MPLMIFFNVQYDVIEASGSMGNLVSSNANMIAYHFPNFIVDSHRFCLQNRPLLIKVKCHVSTDVH